LLLLMGPADLTTKNGKTKRLQPMLQRKQPHQRVQAQRVEQGAQSAELRG
jgi:hypothetical protein